MPPLPITEDYYKILGVEHTAEHQVIVNSFRRLALKLHPDKNPGRDTTEAFQELGRAYETLKDESTRRAYDLVYPSIVQDGRPAQQAKAHYPPQTSVPRPGTLSEEAQIAAIEKVRQERRTRWCTSKNAFESSICKLQEKVCRLEQEILDLDCDISDLDCALAAEPATNASNKSWSAWLLSAIYKKGDDSQGKMERTRQERRNEKDLKQQRMESIRTRLRTQETRFEKARDKFDAADRIDGAKILGLKAIIRRYREREASER